MNSEEIQFVLTTAMILLTLGAAYGGLRLVNWRWQRRMAIIVVPLLLNAVFYLIFCTTPFFYLGVIMLLCIPFVWPRKSA